MQDLAGTVELPSGYRQERALQTPHKERIGSLRALTFGSPLLGVQEPWVCKTKTRSLNEYLHVPELRPLLVFCLFREGPPKPLKANPEPQTWA